MSSRNSSAHHQSTRYTPHIHPGRNRAFREAGVEIPYLQTDIHLRDMDRLEAALAGRATS